MSETVEYSFKNFFTPLTQSMARQGGLIIIKKRPGQGLTATVLWTKIKDADVNVKLRASGLIFVIPGVGSYAVTELPHPFTSHREVYKVLR